MPSEQIIAQRAAPQQNPGVFLQMAAIVDPPRIICLIITIAASNY
jgi:hypothetical protein